MKVHNFTFDGEQDLHTGILLELDIEASGLNQVFKVLGYGICLLLMGIGLLYCKLFNTLLDLTHRVFTSTRGAARFTGFVLTVAIIYLAYILIDALLSGAFTTEIR